MRRYYISFNCFLLVAGITAASAQTELPIFDAHSHYKAEDAEHFSASDIVAILDRENIKRMVVIGEPAAQVQVLYQHAPDRFIPFLGLYHTDSGKSTWMQDKQLLDRLAKQLTEGYYAGIGEIHLFAPQSTNPIFKRIVALAQQHQLPLLLHGDKEIIEQTFLWAPDATVIWAHLGTDPKPEIVDAMLTRYPEGLYIDTSVRDARFIPQGDLLPEWRALMIKHANKLMVGIDTYDLRRWQRISTVTHDIRGWLSQLPAPVAHKIAYENAEKLFARRKIITPLTFEPISPKVKSSFKVKSL